MALFFETAFSEIWYKKFENTENNIWEYQDFCKWRFLYYSFKTKTVEMVSKEILRKHFKAWYQPFLNCLSESDVFLWNFLINVWGSSWHSFAMMIFVHCIDLFHWINWKCWFKWHIFWKLPGQLRYILESTSEIFPWTRKITFLRHENIFRGSENFWRRQKMRMCSYSTHHHQNCWWSLSLKLADLLSLFISLLCFHAGNPLGVKLTKN